MRDKYTAFLRWCLLILFISYYGSIKLLSHSHNFNGVTVVHSHPYKSNPDGQSHNHSASELLVLHYLSDYVSTTAVSFCLPDIVFSIVEVNNFNTNPLYGLPYPWYTYSLRAPPIHFL